MIREGNGWVHTLVWEGKYTQGTPFLSTMSATNTGITEVGRVSLADGGGVSWCVVERLNGLDGQGAPRWEELRIDGKRGEVTERAWILEAALRAVRTTGGRALDPVLHEEEEP